MSESMPEKGVSRHGRKELSWAEMLGSCCRKADLPTGLATDPGLIWMSTVDGLEICPNKQFVLDSDGKRQLVPLVAQAWAIFRDLDRQRGDGNDTTVLRFMAPRTDGVVLLDHLLASEVPENEKYGLLAEIMEDFLCAAEREGTVIWDPRKTLGA